MQAIKLCYAGLDTVTNAVANATNIVARATKTSVAVAKL